MKHLNRNYRNHYCATCAKPTPHDDGCIQCHLAAEERAKLDAEGWLFWLFLAPMGLAALILVMSL